MRCKEKIELVGYVGGDVRAPSKNPDFVTFNVAVQKRVYTKREGTNKSSPTDEKETHWYKCFTSNERLSKIVKMGCISGSRVVIEGIPSLETYQAKDGSGTKAVIAVLIIDIIIVTYGKADQADIREVNGNSKTCLDDDIPF